MDNQNQDGFGQPKPWGQPWVLLIATCEFSPKETTCEALNILPPKVHIKIVNDLSNSLVMYVHCHSGVGDFGIHAIPKRGVYEFDYPPTGLHLLVTFSVQISTVL